MIPIFSWKLVVSISDAIFHGFREQYGRNLRVEWRISTQHDVYDHTQTPHVTALKWYNILSSFKIHQRLRPTLSEQNLLSKASHVCR
jgi:hypothetical protein